MDTDTSLKARIAELEAEVAQIPELKAKNAELEAEVAVYKAVHREQATGITAFTDPKFTASWLFFNLVFTHVEAVALDKAANELRGGLEAMREMVVTDIVSRLDQKAEKTFLFRDLFFGNTNSNFR